MLAECFPDTDIQMAPADKLATFSEHDAAAAAQHAAAHALAAQTSATPDITLSSQIPTGAEPIPALPPAQQLPLNSNLPLLATDQPQTTALPSPAPEPLEAATNNMAAVTGQQAAEAQFPAAQQLSPGHPSTTESLLQGSATPSLGVATSSPVRSVGQPPVDPQDGMQEPAAGSADSMQLAETAQLSGAVQGAAEPSNSAQQAVEVKDEADTVMVEADKRSAADIFEQTVIDCKKVLSDVTSVLLDEAAPDASGMSNSRIAASERATMWQKELHGLLNRCKIPQLYIGVLGDTGAGKSSTINCLLGEENVLPVNGMRACTACVVEISYISSSVYEGTVECMTREEWTAQAKSLWGDLIDERGRLKICRDADRRLNTSSVEGAAQATLETVYGPNNLRRAGMTLERLLETNNKITALLGRTISIREHAVKQFRKRIGEYVDSHNKKDEIQAWPLVKVCKLKHNWQVLSTGAVVVDLPGVRDANAARGAVAEKYMKSCNAVWIVADITRAVDNRTAKDLLGENFRRQMLMDGQYGSITFICTKTDVLQVSETVRAFSQGGGSGRARMCEAAGVPIERYEQAQQRVDEKQDELNKVERIVKSCKKKAKPLAELNEKTAFVRTLKKEEREARAQADKLKWQLAKVQLVVSDVCGRARNSYSKGVLKKDFKDGLLEMEETAADVELDAGGDAAGPSNQQQQQRRRPSKVGDQELPVFCVSAKDCQRLEGRTSKDGPPSAFTKLEHTELPQLRAHVHHVTEQGRLHAARSLQDACHAAFKTELAKLQAAAKELLGSWKFVLEHDCTQGSISPRLFSGAEAAENKAESTQAKWGAHKRDGGYYWATYKATVRPARNGVYKSNACGEINFNADLARPILDGISMQWETLFDSTIIDRLKSYKNTMLRHVAEFLTAVKASLVKLGVDESRLQRITQEVQAHEVRKSTDLLAKVAEDIQARQRDMSRDVIEPTVQNSMTDGYAACCAEVGSGQFDRMRRLMRATVEHHKGSMFTEAAEKLEAAMKAMVVTVAKHLEKAQQSLAARIADTFTILWERPMCSITERRAALASLQGLAGQMQGVCKGAGASVLELVLPEEEEEDAQQENMNPNGAGLRPKQEDEDMEEYDDDEEAEEVDEDDMGEDDEEEDEEEEDNYEEETDGRPFINLYHDTYEEEEDGEEEEDEEEEDGDEGEERAEGLLEVDDDALGVEGRPGTSWDQFEHMLGSGSSATRARRMELAGRDALNPGMIMLQPAAAAGQGSAQLGQPGSHHRQQLQTSTGFGHAARQSLEQRSKTEGTRPCPANAFAQVASLLQAAGPGLSFSLPRPPPGSVPGIGSTFEGLREQGLRTELERTDKGAHAQAAAQSSPVKDEEQQDTYSMAPEVREAALAAAKDAQDAEQFAAQALQSPRLQSSPGSKAHGLADSDAQHDVKPAAVAKEWVEQGLAADMMQSGTPAVTADVQGLQSG
ncbi:hypothetical protein WJX82_006331 [Trebouxia sp. C0006]